MSFYRGRPNKVDIDPGLNGSMIKLLCSGDSFADSSLNHLAVSTDGVATIDTSTKLYGTGSFNFPANGLVTINNSGGQIVYGTNDWTIECWYRCNAINEGAWRPLISAWTPSPNQHGPLITIATDNTLQAWVASAADGTGWTVANLNAGVPEALKWTHVALVRSGTKVSFYLGGTLKASTTVSAGFVPASCTNVYLGGSPGTLPTSFNGNIEEAAITVGQAKYYTSFVPSGPMSPPAAAPNPVVHGQLRRDGSGIYWLCTDKATNTWKRVPTYPRE